MDFLDQILASLLDRFKADSPKVWAAIALLLTTIQVVLMNGVDLGLWAETTFTIKALQVITFGLGLFTGSKTVVFLPKPRQTLRIDTAKQQLREAA